MEIHVVNAFSKDGRGGNPAGIVTDGSLIQGDEERRALAARLGYSETVFRDTSHVADMRLSYFTPEGEVPLCGHATIAFFVLLDAMGRAGKKEYAVETKAGIIGVRIYDDGIVMMSQCLPEFSSPVPFSELADCFGCFEGDIRFEPMIVSTGLRDIMLPVSSPEVLLRMRPDFGKISDLSRKYGCVGVHAFALADEENDTSTTVCRNFAPLYGIEEEAATGTSNCALASYLFRNGIRRDRYVFIQGRNLGCLSEIIAGISSDGETITSVSVGGRGYISSVLYGDYADIPFAAV